MPLFSPCHAVACDGGPGTIHCPTCGRSFPADLVALANIASGHPIPALPARPALYLVPPPTEVQEAS